MARNIEIKAAVADVRALHRRAAECAGSAGTVIDQDDTFFACAHGRLKLRAFGDGTGELIAYERPDAAGPTLSHYRRTPTTAPAALRATLAEALGTAGRVVKRRTLYWVGRTRVHVDAVAGIGDFMELEVVLAEGDTAADGEREAEALMAALGLADAPRIDCAYVDLLARPG